MRICRALAHPRHTLWQLCHRVNSNSSQVFSVFSERTHQADTHAKTRGSDCDDAYRSRRSTSRNSTLTSDVQHAALPGDCRPPIHSSSPAWRRLRPTSATTSSNFSVKTWILDGSRTCMCRTWHTYEQHSYSLQDARTHYRTICTCDSATQAGDVPAFPVSLD